MIEVQNLEKKFGNFKALDGCNMTVKDGSVYGLVGPNGAGKSTIIRHLTGVFTQDAGIVKIDGEDIRDNVSIKEKVAYIPDDWFYYNQATVGDMKRLYSGMYPTWSEERYKKICPIFGISEKQQIRRLSKGMQKQVAFMMTISSMPKYLVLDEPVDGLDPVMRRNVWSLMMEDVSERKTTVLVSSHNLRELEDVCDHVGIINKGKVMIERSLSDLQDNMVKLQVVWQEGVENLPEKLPVMNVQKMGRVWTIIMNMKPEEAIARINMYNPVMVEALPLTLEEIFIYEMGGNDFNAKEILF